MYTLILSNQQARSYILGGCGVSFSIFFPQNVVPDLSFSVRSPILDKWEGIKQLKAALWALVSIFNIVISIIVDKQHII